MIKYRISEPALIDLEDIWLHTFQNWSKDQADRYYSLLLSEYEYLADHFEHGMVMEHISKVYKSSQIKSHIIFLN
ncbi:type II toxin-antitoxin system RelE/ParE family toxin [uncultured Pedobacter sp.]|uniref:type II toxin-antitoxin system RelE/ParE family toxin n=1 Tax=uncultured Pedobacter sp. TaxID=246139 RepID=UPI00345DAC46